MTTPDRKTLIGKVLREAKYVINEDDLREYLLNETYLYRFLTDWLHRSWDIRKTKLRFAANVFPDDMLTCGGTVTRKYYENGEPRVDCQVWQQNHKGENILFGEATFTLPER